MKITTIRELKHATSTVLSWVEQGETVEIRRRNLIADNAYPCASPSGLRFELLSHHAAMNKLMTMMDYDALRAEQAALRHKNIHRGIGIASFIEVTNPSAAFYGVGGARISSQDGVAVRLVPRVR